MQNTNIRKIFAIFLTLALVLGLFPSLSSPTMAADQSTVYQVKTWSELKTALEKKETNKIVLLANIYAEAENEGHVAWVGGRSELDLNGYDIEFYISYMTDKQKQSYNYYPIRVEPGVILHVYDSKGGGEIWTHSTLAEGGNVFSPADRYVPRFGGANIFLVGKGAQLVIDSGEYYAGRSRKTWCTSLFYEGWGPTPHYNGWAYNHAAGTVITNEGGKVVINGGKFTSVDNYQKRGKIYDDKAVGSSLIINDGDFKGFNNAVFISQWTGQGNTNTIIINKGVFSTQFRVERIPANSTGDRARHESAGQSFTNLPTKTVINPEATVKYGGKSVANIANELRNFTKKLEVIPATPQVTLSPERDYEFYQVAMGVRDFVIEAKAETYFSDFGLGRSPTVDYYVMNFDVDEIKGMDARYVVDSSVKGTSSMGFIVFERDVHGKAVGEAAADFLVRVAPEAPPKVSVQARENPVNSGEEVVLVAYVDKPDYLMAKYQWKNLTLGKIIPEEQHMAGINQYGAIFTAPDKEGYYLIECVATDVYGNKGSDTFRLQVGGSGAAPRIATDELLFKYGVRSNGIFIENSGGPVENKSWTYEGKLPQGLEFIASNGLAGFRGTSTEVGKFPVNIKAISGVHGTAKIVNIIVTAPIQITTSTLPIALQSEHYEHQLKISGGGDVKWTITEGYLPRGLALTMDGRLLGTPEASGNYKFTVRADTKGELPASKELSLDIFAKPKYSGAQLEYYVTAGSPNMRIKNPLKEGTAPIVYTITSNSAGISVNEQGDLVAHKAPAKGTYKFTITATGYDNHEAKANVTLMATESPTYIGGLGTVSVELPMAFTGQAYSSGNVLPNNITSTGNKCVWEFIDNMYNPLDHNPLPAGLTLNPDTGVISGTPTVYTGSGSGGYSDQESYRIRLRDTVTNLSERVSLYLNVVDGNKTKAPTAISFSSVDPSLKTQNGVAGHLFLAGIASHGIPTDANISLVKGALPDGLKLHRVAGAGASVSGFAAKAGTYKFTVEADNGFGKLQQELTIVITVPVKATPPQAVPAPGVHKKGTADFKVRLQSADGFVYYSVDGGEYLQGTKYDATSEKWYAEVELSQDSTITAYVESGLGILSDKGNSDENTYKYFFTQGDDQAFVSIDVASLPQGEYGKAYGPVTLTGSASDGQNLNWVASGLPQGLSVDKGKIAGTPEEAGDFKVKLIAGTVDGKASNEKELDLKIGGDDLPVAAKPIFSKQPAGGSYEEQAGAKPLTATASASDGGKVSYTWYQSKDKTSGTPADDKMLRSGETFEPPNLNRGENYFYAVATNSKQGHMTSSTVSNIATITIIYDVATPAFDDLDPREYVFTAGSKEIIMEMATIEGEGKLDYTWYKMSGDKPQPATDKKVTLTVADKGGVLNITTPAAGQVDKYYATVTNTDNQATGKKTSAAVTSPLHLVQGTDKVQHEISLDAQNGEKIEVFLTDLQGKLSFLPTPEKEGYVFSGWFTAATGGTKVGEDQVYTEATTLYGQWSEGQQVPDVQLYTLIDGREYSLDGQKKAFDNVTAYRAADGHTVMAVRLLQDLGAQIGYQQVNKVGIVTVIYGDIKATLTEKSTTMVIEEGGKKREAKLAVPFTNLGGRTYLPTRNVAENLGFFVYWNSADDSIRITR